MATKETPTLRALRILASLPDPFDGISANQFAVRYYTGTDKEYLLSAVSNQGEGACSGKKAWLCAGSFLAKLEKKGLVHWRPRAAGAAHYCITAAGRQYIKEHGA